jgi:hypothetical protein
LNNQGRKSKKASTKLASPCSRVNGMSEGARAPGEGEAVLTPRSSQAGPSGQRVRL